MRVSAQRILDYISGNDIPEEELERLEDNEEFMLEVLKRTKDKATAFYASDRLLKNPSYIRKVIELFKEDIKFVTKIVDKYESLAEPITDPNILSVENIAFDELTVTLANIFKKTQDDRFMKYQMYASGLTKVFQLSILFGCLENESLVEEFFGNSNNLKPEYVLLAYQDSPILADFHIRNIIDNEFEDENFTLEELIHYYFTGVKDPKDIENLEMLLAAISEKNPNLKSYLRDNPQYLQDRIKTVEYIKKAWKQYLDRVNYEKVQYILEEFDEYALDMCEEHNADYLLALAIEEAGLQDVFEKFGDVVFSYRSSKEFLREEIIDTHSLYEDTPLTREKVEQLVADDQEKGLCPSEQEFVIYTRDIMIKAFENDLPIEKMDKKKTEKAPDALLMEQISKDEHATVEIDFVNKKILKVIRGKNLPNSK